MAEDQYYKIGRELKAYFIKINLSQDDMSKILGVSQQYISMMLNGRPFGKKTAHKWANAFGLNVNWLLTGEGQMLSAQASPDSLAEEEKPSYGSSTVSNLTTILKEKETQINRLLAIIEEQAATIKQLSKNNQP